MSDGLPGCVKAVVTVEWAYVTLFGSDACVADVPVILGNSLESSFGDSIHSADVRDVAWSKAVTTVMVKWCKSLATMTGVVGGWTDLVWTDRCDSVKMANDLSSVEAWCWSCDEYGRMCNLKCHPGA